MKKSILLFSVVICGFVLTASAQIGKEYQGTYSQTLSNEPMMTDEWLFPVFDDFKITDFPVQNFDSIMENAFNNIKRADSVMSDFYEGFDNFDTVIQTDNGKMSFKSYSHTYSYTPQQGNIPDSVKEKINKTFDNLRTQSFTLSSDNMPNIKSMMISFGMNDTFDPQMPAFTYLQHSDNGDNTSSHYSVTTADGNVYTDKDIQVIITSNSIEEIISETGETLYLISFDNEDVVNSADGFSVKVHTLVPFTVTKDDNGKLKYKKFGIVPFVLTKTSDNKKALSMDNDTRLSIYPNPSHDVLNVALKENIKTAQLINIEGQTVFSAAINANQTQIYIGNFEKGSYVLRLQTDKNTISKRVVLY